MRSVVHPGLLRQLAALAFIVFMTYAPIAFGQPAAPAPCVASAGPKYFDGRDPAKTSVVVFVHGVASSAASAWGPDASHSWPCLLRTEPAFNNSNIYLYGYDTGLLGMSPSIEKVAGQLLVDLKNEGVLDHAHITIVAHSMGGLVTAKMLLMMNSTPEMRQRLNRIELVQFFGTPATGADLATIASQISDSIQLDEMRKGANQEALIGQWKAAQWPFTWYCWAEGQKTGWFFGTLVVPQDSAWALCANRPSAGRDTLEQFSHITMVKPSSLQDTPHRYLLRSFMSCVSDGLPRKVLPSEASSADGQLMLQAMSSLQTGMSDNSTALANVQAALYQSDTWADIHLMPANPGAPALTVGSFERQPGRTFALEFLKLFQAHPEALAPIWVGRVKDLERYAPDGQLIELHQAWLSAGAVQDSDFLLALDKRSTGEQVLIVGSIQTVAGQRKGRIRNLLILPAQPKTCA